MMEKLRAAYQRMNQRERIMTLAIAAVLLLLINLFIWKLQKTQPTLTGAEEASTLLDQLKQIAGKYNVLIENPAIGSGETTPTHQAVFASIETSL